VAAALKLANSLEKLVLSDKGKDRPRLAFSIGCIISLPSEDSLQRY
jgi:hypothetical protein